MLLMGDVPLILQVQRDVTPFQKAVVSRVRCHHMTAVWLTGLTGETD